VKFLIRVTYKCGFFVGKEGGLYRFFVTKVGVLDRKMVFFLLGM
jgi:hypothetical protein